MLIPTKSSRCLEPGSYAATIPNSETWTIAPALEGREKVVGLRFLRRREPTHSQHDPAHTLAQKIKCVFISGGGRCVRPHLRSVSAL